MVQFNLLPDVKLAFIKARRTKYLVLMAASLAAGISLTIMIMLLLAVNVFQKSHLSRVDKDIKKHTSDLQKIPDLTKILTIQNQLKSIPALNSKKPVTSRLFGYLGQVVPAEMSITGYEVNFAEHTMQFTGAADTLDRVNVFADTLKFTTFSTQNDTKLSKNAFSNVVLTSFARTATNTTYSISVSYDETIFNGEQLVTMTVPPNKTTTRSQTDQPSVSPFKETDSTNPTAP